VRDKSCLFVSIDAMLRKIKNSFNDKESRFTEEYFNKLLSNVDFLVLDDLGAETGAIDTSKTATDFVQRVLYGITNTRQDKATILTTNLDSKTLFSMYDKKLVSRLFRKPKYVIFKESKDKRTSNIPF
jgi:DNA replication protein DnaC